MELSQRDKLHGAARVGGRWQSALAAELGIADRSLRYWLAGRSPIPPAVRDELRGLLRANQAEIGGLLRELERVGECEPDRRSSG